MKQLAWTKKKIILGSKKKITVLEITPSALSSFHELAKQVDLWGNYHQYHLYNVDLRIPTRYLQSCHLFFNAMVHESKNRLFLDDDQWAIDYCIPDFSSCTFAIQQQKKAGSLR